MGGWEDNIKMGIKYTQVGWKHVVWINLTQNRDRYDAFVNFWFLEYYSKFLLPEYQTTRRHSVIVSSVRTSNIVPNCYKIHNLQFSHRITLCIRAPCEGHVPRYTAIADVRCRVISFCFTAGFEFMKGVLRKLHLQSSQDKRSE